MGKKIAVIVDLQQDFCGKDGALSNAQCVEAANNAAKLLNEKNFDEVIYTLDTHYGDYLETQEGKNLPIKHCISGSEGWYLRKDIADAVSKWAEKHQETHPVEVIKGTFGYDQWRHRLVDVEKIVNPLDFTTEFYVFGCCTDICVVSNALGLKAAFPEMPIYVIKDCCAGVSVPSHTAALKTMKMCQINEIKSKQYNG